MRVPSLVRKVFALALGFFESPHEIIRVPLRLLFFREQGRLDVGVVTAAASAPCIPAGIMDDGRGEGADMVVRKQEVMP